MTKKEYYNIREKIGILQQTSDFLNQVIEMSEIYPQFKQMTLAEQKFKVGDWIVQKNLGIYKIVEVCESWYEVISYKNGIQYSIGFDKENDCHLWTIQDAKDGDVLFHSDSASNGIFIFKELLKYKFNEKVICYCDYDSEDHFCLGEHHTCCWADAKILHPATKEQRDLLFQKMHEAGYIWYSESKQLLSVKAEQNDTQNPAWSEEDERAIGIIKIALEHPYDMEGKWDRKFTLDWLKSLKGRCTWKPSDLQMQCLLSEVEGWTKGVLNKRSLNHFITI